MRLRTKLLIATVVLIVGLTGASLWIVQRMVRAEVQRQLSSSVNASLEAFQTVQRDREEQLSRTAALLAELPTLKSLMATQDESTVQDGSRPFWRLSGSDLFILAAPDGRLLAFNASVPGWSEQLVARHLRESLERYEESAWWFDNGRLYWVFVRPLTAGSGRDARDLGFVAIGYEVNKAIAQELALASRSDIVLAAGGKIIASTLPGAGAAELGIAPVATPGERRAAEKVLSVDDAVYLAGSVVLRAATPEIRCHVLVPMAESQAFLDRLNRTILILGVAAIAFGALIFSLISRAMTRPLENVVAGVHALANGDYRFRIYARGSREVAQLAEAFSAMRTRLLESQKHQLAAERVAALDRTASSISHDLRHYLAAVVANAEFLYDAESLNIDREEVYREIKIASDQMVDLIDSLRELSRDPSSLSRTDADLEEAIRRAIDAVDARRDFRHCDIEVAADGDLRGVFDARKIERVFFNLILNACEATIGRPGKVRVEALADDGTYTVRVSDNGSGIPEVIRENLFDPFVSSGKTNGTGLGLAIVSKIVGDHGGAVTVEKTSGEGTVILMTIPRGTAVPSPKLGEARVA